jgi:hypothetical protein
MFNESMVKSKEIKRNMKIILLLFLFRITGEPLFGNSTDGLMYSEQFSYGNSNEHSPSVVQAGAVGFDFHSDETDLRSVLSAAIGHRQILHGIAGYNPDESDDDVSEDYDDIDDDDDDNNVDEQSNGHDSSQGELDE